MPIPNIYSGFIGNGSIVSFVDLPKRMGSSYTTSHLNGELKFTSPLHDIIDFQPNFIKMDIEGAELVVMQASPKIFKNASLVIELNKSAIREHFGYHVNDLIDELYKLYSTIYTQVGVTSKKELKTGMEKLEIIDVLCVN